MTKNNFTLRIYINSRFQGYKNASKYNIALFNGTLDIHGAGKWLLDLIPLDQLVMNRAKLSEELFTMIMETSKDIFPLITTNELLAARLYHYPTSRRKEPAAGFCIMDVRRNNIFVVLTDDRFNVDINGIYPLNTITAEKRGRKIADFIASSENDPIAA